MNWNRLHLHEFEPRPIGDRKEVGAKSFVGIHIEIIGSRSKVIHIEGPQGFEVPRVDRNMLDFHEKKTLRKTAANATRFRHGFLLRKKLENSVRLSRKFERNCPYTFIGSEATHSRPFFGNPWGAGRSLRLSLAFHKEERTDAGPKDDQADDGCPDGCQQNSSRSDILGPADQGMIFLGGGIGEELESCIQCFRGPNGGHGQHDRAPFTSREIEIETRGKHPNCSQGVDPGIVLGAEQMKDPAKGVLETPDAAAELKGTADRSGSALIRGFAPRWSALVHLGVWTPNRNTVYRDWRARLMPGQTREGNP